MARFPRLVVWVPFAAVLALASLTHAQEPAKSARTATVPSPWFVDDEKLFDDFMDKLTDLAKAGKCLAHDKLIDKLKPGTRARVSLTAPGEKVLSAEEVYKTALPSVFIIGSVHKATEKKKGKEKEPKEKEPKEKERKDKDPEWTEGIYATAWVAAADGVLVTNWHVFEDLEEDEVFGAVDYKGNVYPVVDFLGGDKVADVAVVRIAASGLKPLPLASAYQPVGAWVGVLGHPGDNYFVFTQGFVTRYSTNVTEEGIRERWMGLTAEYAGGSSGSPVLDQHGAVVGMAALTLTIDGTPGAAAPDSRKPGSLDRRRRLAGQPPLKAPPPHEKPELKEQPPKPEQMPGAGSSVQMILKMAVPGPGIRKSFGKPVE